ncbi:MAG: hypothetical protein EXR73_00015 [Myxococcales bacterium]|nr:hypothetical protein [Myxococcales bacterium]
MRRIPLASSCCASLVLAVSFVAALSACGDDAAPGAADAAVSPTADGAALADAPPVVAIDAAPPRVDATPSPDAQPINTDCSGETPPTTAPNPITVGGTVTAQSAGGSAPEPGVLVEARLRSTGAVLASAISAADGSYTMSFSDGTANPTQPAVDGYLHLTKDALVPSNVFAPEPLYQDQPNLNAPVFAQATLMLLPFLIGITPCTDGYGFLGVIVVDCDGATVPDAVISIATDDGAPGSTVSGCETLVIYANADSLPDTSLTATSGRGLALIFNVPSDLGPIWVSSERLGMSFHAHVVDVLEGEFSLTVLHP